VSVLHWPTWSSHPATRSSSYARGLPVTTTCRNKQPPRGPSAATRARRDPLATASDHDNALLDIKQHATVARVVQAGNQFIIGRKLAIGGCELQGANMDPDTTSFEPVLYSILVGAEGNTGAQLRGTTSGGMCALIPQLRTVLDFSSSVSRCFVRRQSHSQVVSATPGGG
jgi:hypothetical protein